MTPAPSPAMNGTILVVDDEALVRRTLGKLLTKAGYAVRFADDGPPAVEAFDAPDIDLVILDLNLPSLLGFEVCRRIRATPFGADVPVLMLTGEAGDDLYEKAIQSGVDDFLHKPIHHTELLIRVGSMLRLGALLVSLREGVGTLQTQYAALQSARQERDQLNGFLLHDLKSPLSTILLQSDLMAAHHDLDEAQRRAWGIVTEAGYHAQKLVEGWLDFSHWEEKGFALDIHPVPTHEFIESLRAGVEPWLRHKHLHFASTFDDALPVIHLDATAMSRVLRNILDNCVRYAPKDSLLGIDIRQSSPQVTQIRVSDQGPGVPAGEREGIFDIYAQLEATSSRESKHNHHGMGLAYCKLAVEAHGGRIWVEDAVPVGGTCFVIDLPPWEGSA